MHRHRAVKIESLAKKIFLDSKEVCVKLEKWSHYEYKSSICLSHQELLIAYAFRNIPWRTNMASINWGYYIAFKVKSLL